MEESEDIQTRFKGLGPLNKIGKCLLEKSLKKNLTMMLSSQMKIILENSLSEFSLISELYVHVLN